MKYKVGLSDRKDSKGFTPSNFRSRPSTSSKSTFLGSFLDRKNPAKRIANTTPGGRKKGTFKERLGKFVYISIGVLFFLGLIALIVAGIYLKRIEAELPNVDTLESSQNALSTEIYDRNGLLLYTIHGDQNRQFVPLSDIPDQTKWALLAAEDINFYQHKGIDIASIARAVYVNLTHGGASVQGASTISQQLIRITVLKDALGTAGATNKNYLRKVQEILLTMKMEQVKTKDQILQKYMNEVPLGGVNYGYEAAAKYYFGKDVKNLDLAQSALLAGLIQSPSVYSPITGSRPDLAVVRQDYVLDQMLKHKDLTGVTQAEVDAAKKEKLVYKSADANILAPHFVFYVKQLLVDKYGEQAVETGGLKVTTTLDYSVQKIAEEEIKAGTQKYGKPWGVNNGAGVVIDPKTGDILAMVGSVDYYNSTNKKIDGNVNVVISPRQMGSSVKPYNYITAFHMGYGPWLLTPDIKEFKFGGYQPSDWDNKYYGAMLARQAIIESRNIPAVYTLQMVGISNFVNTAQTFGITSLNNISPDSYGLSLTLGSADMTLLEHASAYTVFANEGIKIDVRPILKVVDSTGKTLEDNSVNPGKRVWDDKEIYEMNWILCDIGNFGDQPLDQEYWYGGKRMYCGKTGTTNGPTDLNAIVYHKNLLVAIWNGNNDNTPVPGAWSTTVPLPIASNILTRLASKYKPEGFTRPAGVVAAQVCADTGELANKDTNCKKVATVYITGHAPAPDTRQKIEVCKDSNLVSSNPDVASKFGVLVSGFVLNKKLENTAQQANFDKYISGIKSPKFFAATPATADCKLPLGPDNAPVVSITSPSNGANEIAGSSVTITAQGQALQAITKIEFYFNNILIDTVTASPYTTTYTIPVATPAGVYPIKAIIYDDLGKTGSDQININVTAPVISVSMTDPTNGFTITTPAYTLKATVSNGTATGGVAFNISGPSGYTKTGNATFNGTSWVYNWNLAVPSAPNGAYTIQVIATGATIATDNVSGVVNR